MTTRYDGEFESGFDREILHELQGEFEGVGHLEDELETSLHGESSLHEYEFEDELESEQFFKGFKRIARGIGGFVKKAAPILGQIAKIAVPLVANAVAPGIGGMIASRAVNLLGEEEWEDELAHELGGLHETGLHEAHLEGILHEGHPESVLHELGGLHEGHLEGILHEGHLEHSHELLAEVMAEAAAGAHLEAEAEAVVGAAVVTTLSATDRAALRRLIPHLVRGAAVLTRLLRRRRITRPAVRTVPLIVRQTARTLRRRAASGAPVNRRVAGQVMGSVARKVLGNPRVCAMAIGKNVKANMRSKRGGRRVAG
jgi:hypothetical protein